MVFQVPVYILSLESLNPKILFLKPIELEKGIEIT